jgi:colanic acid/amylovoran biosynthesis protein
VKKKIAIFSQSIGPFKKITIPLARLVLNRTDLIIVRENVTKNYLKAVGVNNPPIYLAAEIAFLLESVPAERVQEIFSTEGIKVNEKNRPLIGIGGSELTYRGFKSKKNEYIELMAKIADYLVEKLNAKVIFISHVIIPPEYGYFDDRFVAQQIYQLVRNKNEIRIIKNDYSPQELKSIIGKSDLFIGARMHSNIASLSMHVPTIALSWSHKYYGIMKMLEQEKYVCDIRTATFDEIVSKINDVWFNRYEIREKLASKSAEMDESALTSARLVKKLMDSIE